MESPGQTGDYQITYSENFSSYSIGTPFFDNNVNWKRSLVGAGGNHTDPTIESHPFSGKILRILPNGAPGDTRSSSIVSTVSRVPALGNSGVGPSGFNERDRWAIIAEFYPFRAPDTDGEHFAVFLRVREQPQISNQTRFGIDYQQAPGNGCNSRAFLQFTGVDPADPDPTNPTMPLQNANVCFDSDPAIDWANTAQRYAVTLEEWLQLQDPFGGHRLHWLGSVYSVNTLTWPWTYTCLGSKKWQTTSINNDLGICLPRWKRREIEGS